LSRGSQGIGISGLMRSLMPNRVAAGASGGTGTWWMKSGRVTACLWRNLKARRASRLAFALSSSAEYFLGLPRGIM
jgi:hypothetical protein